MGDGGVVVRREMARGEGCGGGRSSGVLATGGWLGQNRRRGSGG